MIWSPDADMMLACQRAGASGQILLQTPADLPPLRHDAEMAFIMMFHDHDWEPALLQHALASDAFYVGAMGSAKTHTNRCDALRARGVSEADIARIHGPIGLVPSMRDASMLAVSVMAEIVGVYNQQEVAA